MEFIAKSFNELSSFEIYEILKLRAEIFVVEQGMNCLDPDGVDYKSLHIFIKSDDKIIAYMRAFLSDELSGAVTIGRVLTLNHGKGHGKLLMEYAIDQIPKRFNVSKIFLHSQKQVVDFYKKFGFKTISDEFFEEGIPHISMQLDL